MSPRTFTWLILFAMLAAGGLRLRFTGRDSDELAREQAAYETVRSLILERYVHELNPEERQKVFYGALKGMTASLDAHSQFLPPELYDNLSTTIKGRFAGIGIEISMEARGLTVVTPLVDSPAWKAGVFPGDRIVKIDGEPTDGLSLEESDLRIKGPVDTPIQLTLERDGTDNPIVLSMRRVSIQVKSIRAEEILGPPFIPAGGPKIGYVQIGLFQQNTADELDAALKRLEAQGMAALILDLRDNHGGLLEEAKLVGSLFLHDGLIVTLQYRDPRKHETHMVQPGRTHPDYPMAVLVDSQSASAAEIVSGALRDRGRAVLVGDKTYGKFSVQDVISIPLGKMGPAPAGKEAGLSALNAKSELFGALKLTIAAYKTPTSECIDGQGLVPEYLVPSTHSQQRALFDSRYRRHLRDNDPREKISTTQPDSFDDAQLKKAVEVLKGKIK